MKNFLRISFAALVTTSLVAVTPVAATASAKKPVASFKINTMGAGKTYKFSKLISTKSKGAQTWKVQGDCTLNKKKKTITTSDVADGTCAVSVSIKKSGKYKSARMNEFFSVDIFPSVLPAPAGTDTTPAADGVTNRGWFQAQLTTSDGVTVSISSAHGEQSESLNEPYLSCRRYVSGGVSIRTTGLTGQGEQNLSLSLSRDRYVYSEETVNYHYGSASLYEDLVSTSPRRWAMDVRDPASEYHDPYGSGSTGITLDGAGANFNLNLVATDADGTPIAGGATGTLSGYVTCTWG